jgi:hypothetical protein
VARTRPDTINALQELVKETDSGLTLQMQKFGAYISGLLPHCQVGGALTYTQQLRSTRSSF